MSDAAIHDIAMAAAPTLMALASLIVAWRNGTASQARGEVAAAKQDVQTEKLDQIHTLTNDNLSKVSTQLEVANTKIEGLHQLATEKAQKTK